MLTYRNTNIIFLLLLILLTTLKITTGLAGWYFALAAIGYLLVVSHGSYYVDSNFFMPVICEVQTSERKIALTFDDGPAVNFTPALLEVLKKYNVHAAFFCVGNRIPGNENIIKEVIALGHIIGNHSYSHHYLFDFFSEKKMLDDLSKMNESFLNLSGKRCLLFRPPYGVTTPAMKRVMETGNYTAVGWNIRSLDTVIKDQEQLFNRVTKAIKPGSVILFHDTSETTLNILPRVIEHAIGRGYTFERLDKLLNKPAYA
jgi:peptidoglycan/xylan/chitin deacetylase (PgdA/CDA1 family)